MRQSYRWPLVLLLSTLLVGVTHLRYIPVVTPLVMAWFFLVCPGIAIVGLLPVKQLSIQISLVFALSMAVNTLLAELMAFTHLWLPGSAFWLIAGLCIGGAILQVWQSWQLYPKYGVTTKPPPPNLPFGGAHIEAQVGGGTVERTSVPSLLRRILTDKVVLL